MSVKKQLQKQLGCLGSNCRSSWAVLYWQVVQDSEQNGQLTTPELSSGFTLSTFDITVSGPINVFHKVEIPLEMGLNCIDPLAFKFKGSTCLFRNLQIAYKC